MRIPILGLAAMLSVGAAGAAHAQVLINAQQAAPTPCADAPASDTLLGSPGSMPCYVSRDATRPTMVQAANTITDSTGAWTVPWARAFATATPIVNPLPVNVGALPILCNVGARSATAVSGKCWQSTSTTLGGTLAAILGLVISPFGQPAANVAVMVVARDPTQ